MVVAVAVHVVSAQSVNCNEKDVRTRRDILCSRARRSNAVNHTTTQQNFAVSVECVQNQLLAGCYFIFGALEDLGEDSAAHLFGLLDAVNVQERGGDVVDAGG